jgi:indole-3-glycerol phosphate synthase
MNILEEIVAHKRVEVDLHKRTVPEADVKGQAVARPKGPDFKGALACTPMGLIAEVKRRSPSAGALRDPFDPAAIASAYAGAGAQAVSVLMDERYFGGGEDDFRAVRNAIERPLLYKEFVIDTWQVWHAAALGASAVLLIAAVLDDGALRELVAGCREARVEPLLEVHDAEEMKRAGQHDVTCIGINNRNLKTFEVSIETTLRLKDDAPASGLLISESGIRSADDVSRLRAEGVAAVLVGEHLLRQPDLASAVHELMSTT